MASNSVRDIALSDEQLQAVESTAQFIVVVASAGSGKTEVVARRVQRLLEHSEPTSGRVLALTYTVKAADELRSRLRKRGGNNLDLVDTETVHGFAHALLRQHGTKIGLPLEPELLTRDEDRAELLNLWRQSEGRPQLEDPIEFLRDVDLLRAKLKTDTHVDDWENALASVSALDFSALLTAARRLLEVRSARRQLERVYSHIIVDEAQNLTPAQYELITSILGTPGRSDGPTAMFVGDNKQSIISFAGADPNLLNQFSEDYQAVSFRLETNFRSAQKLSELAARIARSLGNKNSTTPLHAAEGSIELIDTADETTEGEFISTWVSELLNNGLPKSAVSPSESRALEPEDIAVIGRSTIALQSSITELVDRAIPVSVVGGANDWLEGAPGNVAMEIISLKSAESHRSTHWQLARLLSVSPTSVQSLELLRQTLSDHGDLMMRSLLPLVDSGSLREFISNLTQITPPVMAPDSELSSWSADAQQLRSAWNDFDLATERGSITWANFKLFCARRQRGQEGPGVQILTIHKSQGREFRAVALVGFNDGQLPDFRNREGPLLEAELRAFYVAVTRSRRVLLLTRARSRMTRYGSRATSLSPFADYLVPK